MSRPVLPSSIIQACDACSPDDRKSIVAYCCHLAFSDRSLRRMEVEFVRAIADHMEFSPIETARLSRKARRRRLKIKRPKSVAARKLMLNLAFRLMVVDQKIDARERSSIESLAEQLGVPRDTVDKQMEKLALSIDQETARRSTRSLESLTRSFVAEDLEATLFAIHDHNEATAIGVLEYSRTDNGTVELELDVPRLQLASTEIVTVSVAGSTLCKFIGVGGVVSHAIRTSDAASFPSIATDDTAEIAYSGSVQLRGDFR